jgi:hypothetical protein
VAGRFHKRLELAVRHRRRIDPEAVHGCEMDRRFLRVVIVGSHAECAAGDPDHVARGLVCRWQIKLFCI